ncbi:patatin-like phospholipase family protein [Saccharopolyspora spinosa]|uniref:NTE family protein n=1 Tax=Saccharopolyspora spinosa TaxID=60894 RepID=A0A2N3XZW5_SACSN|nr:patatin-like phospholipase family protein [Saccharopolyspora spinosa]PKW16215.1 NTE family protein [Saccharopolyspora spinosa]
MPVVKAERIAFVLAGGGARGAYEAGALSILMPALERLGQRPSMFVGTSVGALNAAYLAASQHLSVAEATGGLLECWRAIGRTDVLFPLHRQLPLLAVRYLGEILSAPGVRFASLLDPKPFERNVDRWIDLSSMHSNVTDGRVSVLAIVATAARTGHTVGFVEGLPETSLHRSHVIDYIPAQITHAHLRASAALPVLFPPVRVDAPDEARGWYVDGGTRLNTPIKPALDLGADRVVVVGTDAVTNTSHEPGRHEGQQPDLVDGALHLLEGALVDPLAEDIVVLGNVNLFYSDPAVAMAAARYRHARGKPPYRQVPYIFVAPDHRGAMGELALQTFHTRVKGRLDLRSLARRVLHQVLGGDSPAHGELLSYLLFDHEFLEELIAQGRNDARRRLEQATDSGHPWQIGPLPELTLNAPDNRER